MTKQVWSDSHLFYFKQLNKQNKKQYEKSEKTDARCNDVLIIIRSKSTRDYI